MALVLLIIVCAVAMFFLQGYREKLQNYQKEMNAANHAASVQGDLNLSYQIYAGILKKNYDIRPKDKADIVVKMCGCKLFMGNFHEAMQLCDEAKRYDSSHPEVYSARAMVMLSNPNVTDFQEIKEIQEDLDTFRLLKPQDRELYNSFRDDLAMKIRINLGDTYLPKFGYYH